MKDEGKAVVLDDCPGIFDPKDTPLSISVDGELFAEWTPVGERREGAPTLPKGMCPFLSQFKEGNCRRCNRYYSRVL